MSRPALTIKLAECAQSPFTLVVAPAGFGKTSALSQLASQLDAAWLTLSQAESDPVRFWRSVGEALGAAKPGLEASWLLLLSGSSRPAILPAVTALINSIMEQSESICLILDDFHLVDGPEVAESVSFLVEHIPEELRLVIASRSEPRLPLARLRARGLAVDIGRSDLRFDPRETAALLNRIVGGRWTPADALDLTERTEGWVAGVKLAALSARQHRDPRATIAAVSGRDRFISDYLVTEVLAGLSSD